MLNQLVSSSFYPKELCCMLALPLIIGFVFHTTQLAYKSHDQRHSQHTTYLIQKNSSLDYKKVRISNTTLLDDTIFLIFVIRVKILYLNKPKYLLSPFSARY